MSRAVRFTPEVRGAPEIEVTPDLLRGPRVRVGGQRIRMTRDAGRPVFLIPMADGTTRPLRIVGGFLGLHVRFEDVDHEIEPPLRLWETFLVLLPLAILYLGLEAPSLAGTVVAALITCVAVTLALVAIRASWPAPVRVVAALAVSAVGYVAAQIVAASI